MTPGMYEVSAELASFKKYSQRDVRLEVGRTTPVELKLEVGGLTEAVTVTSEAPLVDTTTQEIGGRISAAGVRRHAVVQPQLRRLPRHAAGRGGDDFGDDVWRRLDQRRRPERPQRELHDGRVEQQRHVQRRQRRRPGARAGRSGAGIPAAEQPVRRRVRAHLRRRRQLGLEVRAPTACAARRSCSSRTRTCRRWSTSRRRKGWRRRRPSSSSSAACSADRSSATRRISSAASSASCSTHR